MAFIPCPRAERCGRKGTLELRHVIRTLLEADFARHKRSGSPTCEGQWQPDSSQTAIQLICKAMRTAFGRPAPVEKILLNMTSSSRRKSNTKRRLDRQLYRERERERDCTTSIQPAWLMMTDLCSCLGHLQNGCEAMANSLLVLMPHEQTHGAFNILKQIGILSPDVTKARAVKNVMKLIANSLREVLKAADTLTDAPQDSLNTLNLLSKGPRKQKILKYQIYVLPLYCSQ